MKEIRISRIMMTRETEEMFHSATCLPQNPEGITRDRIRHSAVRYLGQTA
jgi:hypothetical protein